MIDHGSPVNWRHPLNRGLKEWWLCLPGVYSGAKLRNLCAPANLDNLRHGTLTNITPSGTSGYIPTSRPGGYGGIRLDGTDDYIVVNPPTATAVPMYSIPPFTVGMSVYFASVGGIQVSHYVDGNINTGWRIQVQSGSNFGITFASVADYSFGITLSASRWYDMLITVDANGGTATGYLKSKESGLQIGSSAVGTMAGSPNKFLFGTYDALASFTSGIIDNIQMFNRCLSRDEAIARLQQSSTGYPNLLNRFGRTLTRYAVPAAGGGGPSGTPMNYYAQL